MRTANLLTEQKLLGNIIVQPDVWHEVATDFRAEMFSDPVFRTIAETLVELTEGGKRPSSVRLYKACKSKGLDVTIDDLIKVITGHVTVRETKALLAELEDLYKRRTVYQTLLTALNKLQQEDKETDELIAEAQQAMISAFDKTGRSELKTMHHVAEKLFERQERIQSGQEPPTYSTSLVGLQTRLGGYETGTLNIIAGRPSMGKTSFMLNEGLHLAKQGLPGVIFSLEQEDIQIGRRNIANLEGIPVNYMRSRMEEKQLERFYGGLSQLRELPIKISDRRGLTVDQVCSLARVEKMRNPELKWFAVDYLQCLQFRGQSRYLDVGDAVRKLRDLAGELDVVGILLSQLNRGLENRPNKRPILADLRDSGNIEEFADTVIFLYREGYYQPGFLGEEGDWITEIQVAKNREGGGAGRRALAMFQLPYMRWIDCPSDWAESYAEALKGG